MFIIDALNAFADWILSALIWLVSYLWSWVVDALAPPLALLLQQFLDILPVIDADPAQIRNLLAIADYWLPCNECFVILTAYWTFVVSAAGIRIIIKLIPWVG